MDLNQIRIEIDAVDQQMLKLFQTRMKLAAEVAESKKDTGKAIYDKKREEEKLSRLIESADSEFNRHSIEELFSQIMAISRRYQYSILGDRDGKLVNQYHLIDNLVFNKTTRVAYQGVPGAFGEQAMLQFFGNEIQSLHVEQFEEVLNKLDSGEADYGILPIENSSAGFVSGIYDMLEQHDVMIVGESVLEVEQDLLGFPGATIDDIQVVYSHPQGLLQTQEYLRLFSWRQESQANTAISAKKIHDDGDIHQAAIASSRAAELYGLQILKKGINSDSQNATRFVVVSKQKVYTKDARRVSIRFALPHQSGSLYNILAHFIFNNLNMTSIESRPLLHKSWEYCFFITFEGNLQEAAVVNALISIQSEVADFKLLGNY